jgi:integrase
VFDRLILPALGDRPIAEIKRSEIVRLIDGVADRQGPSASAATLAYLSKVFNWHASRDDEFRTPIARGMSKPKAKGRDRTLSDDELRQLWATAEGTFGRYLRFLLLTAVRRNEAANMVRGEIVGDLWTIPAQRMKGKVEHVVPLSKAALALITMQAPTPTHDAYVRVSSLTPPDLIFPGLGSLARLKAAFDARVPIAPWRLHDLRRTASTLMTRAGVNADVVERCLAHTIGGVRGIYNRHDYLAEKRQAFERLATLIQGIVDPQPNVVTLRG